MNRLSFNNHYTTVPYTVIELFLGNFHLLDAVKYIHNISLLGMSYIIGVKQHSKYQIFLQK